MVTEPSKATRAEDVRDLKREISGLEREDLQEIIFKETSPKRRKVTIYNMTNGEPVLIPTYMADGVMLKVLPDGTPMFTGYKERAPEYRMGTTLCFLAKNSAERAVLDSIGLAGAVCRKVTLANRHEKRIHAQNRHSREWAAYQDHLNEKKEQDAIDRQEKQLEATLALARGAAESRDDNVVVNVAAGHVVDKTIKGICDVCGKGGWKNVGSHKRMAHG